MFYNPRDDFIYWAEATGHIHRSKPNGSSSEVILKSLQNPTSIAVDIASGNIYWAEDTANRISVAKTDGSHPRVVVYTEEPHAIVLDISNG